jgi:serine/threonine protein kinase
MTPERWKKIEELFETAVKQSPADRPAFLDEVCGDDRTLRAEIELMLAHQQPTGRFITTLAQEAAKLLPRIKPDDASDVRFIPGAVLAERYRIIGLLGRGGMGEVYRADDLKLAQPVALKFLPEKLSKNPDALSRFHAEVRTARKVSHPNVCRVFDIGEVDGLHFLSMEYIDGEDLSSLLRRIGRLPEDKAVEIARQLCAGLAAAHEEGVLHRDLKPANIMLDGRGRARITDFGLAGLADEFQSHEIRSGTPAYMSPEQLAGKEVTVKSDIYALGVTLYEIFTGKKAFAASSLDELIKQQETSTPASISSLIKDVDPLVERVILRCLEKDSKARPASAAQIAALLPGGDPLAAAIAAGETPSPEMVAAAPRQGALRPAVGALCFAVVIFALIFISVASEKASLLNIVSPKKSPEALRERTTEIVKRLGYGELPADAAYNFENDYDYLEYFSARDKTPERWQRLKNNRPAALRFWYRQSPGHLEARTNITVTPDDPPPIVPGMLQAVTDTEGRLLKFIAVPSEVDRENQTQSSQHALDYRALFEEAGLSLDNFKPAEPQYMPPGYADERAAWEGTFPSLPEIPMRVEAASLRGRPVYFEVLGEWSKPQHLQLPDASAESTRFFGVIFLVFMTVITLGGLLAKRNLRLGRSDRKSAFRLAALIFALSLVSWLIGASHVPTFRGELTLFWFAVAGALMQTAIVWVLYVALEPYVRRRTPHRIVSWSRLVAGNWRDPMVGRDILIGMILGLGIHVIRFTGSYFLPMALGQPGEIKTIGRMSTLLGAPEIGNIFFGWQLFMSLLHGMGYILLLLLLTLVLRKNWLATFGLWLLFMLPTIAAGELSPITLLLTAVTWASITFVVARFGLLAMVAAQFFYFMGLFYPYTTDFSAWYAANSIFALLVCALFAAYGFYTSVGGRTAFKLRLLED